MYDMLATAVANTLASEMREQVAAGTHWLDLNAPGWEHAVDPGRLDLSDPYQCVAGQVGLAGLLDRICGSLGERSGYYALRDRRGNRWAEDRGFNLTARTVSALDSDACRSGYGILGDTWLAVIKERFATGNLSG